MSADRWSVCPRCEHGRLEVIADRQAELDAAYGQLPLAEFDALRAAQEQRCATRLEPTFREDWEFYGLEDCAVTVEYRGQCRTCALTVRIDHTQPIDIAR